MQGSSMKPIARRHQHKNDNLQQSLSRLSQNDNIERLKPYVPSRRSVQFVFLCCVVYVFTGFAVGEHRPTYQATTPTTQRLGNTVSNGHLDHATNAQDGVGRQTIQPGVDGGLDVVMSRGNPSFDDGIDDIAALGLQGEETVVEGDHGAEPPKSYDVDVEVKLGDGDARSTNEQEEDSTSDQDGEQEEDSTSDQDAQSNHVEEDPSAEPVEQLQTVLDQNNAEPTLELADIMLDVVTREADQHVNDRINLLVRRNERARDNGNLNLDYQHTGQFTTYDTGYAAHKNGEKPLLGWMATPQKELNECKRTNGCVVKLEELATCNRNKDMCKAKFWSSVTTCSQCSGIPTRMDRVPFPTTAAEFRRYSSRGNAIVFTGMFDYQFDRKWDIELLRRLIGKSKFSVRYGDYSSLGSRKFVTMTLNNYLDILYSKTNLNSDDPTSLPPYLGNNALPPKIVNKLGLEFPPYFPRSFFYRPKMWLGKKGSVSPLHADASDNFCFMLIGVKRFIIFPPEDFGKLKYNAKTLKLVFSRLGLLKADDVKAKQQILPDGTHPIVVELHPGETMYLPAGWSHTIENVEDSLMVNYWVWRHQMVLTEDG